MSEITNTVDAVVGSRWHRLYHGETTIDFMGRRKIGYTISAVLLVLTVVGLVFNGLNLGIDFEGGQAYQFNGSATSVERVESVLSAEGITIRDAKIQVLGRDPVTIKVQTPVLADAERQALRDALAADAGVEAQDVSLDTVSSTWGGQVTRKALIALVVFFILLAIYISLRFEWKMAVASIVAVLHDVAISVGIYALFGFPVTPATVIAFLTILGFSLYDTIVVFDKVQENQQRFGSRASYGDIVNLSMNQVLMRSINTSIAAVLPVLSVLVVGSMILGVVALQDFALALLIGLLAGSYSSIFIATPILAWLKEREPRYAALKGTRSLGADLARLRVGEGPATARHRIATAAAAASGAVAGPVVADTAAALTHPPRPRKKRR
jgi:preprotein translocase subunit SecF